MLFLVELIVVPFLSYFKDSVEIKVVISDIEKMALCFLLGIWKEKLFIIIKPVSAEMYLLCKYYKI